MDEILSPITPNQKEDNQKILESETLEIESDKNNKIEIKISKSLTKIIIEGKHKNIIESIVYFSQKTIEEIKMNKYFLMFDNLDEIYSEILNLMKNNKVCINEEINKLIIKIPLTNIKIKEIKIILNKKEKSDKERIDDLYSIIDNMKSYYNKKIDELINVTQLQNNKINELDNINQQQNNKINELYNINQKQNNKINELNNKIENLKEIIEGRKNNINIPKNENVKSIFSDSIIINNNQNYISNLNKWINQREGKFNTKLLFRKSNNGNSFDEFHRLCDNQGKTLVLIQTDNNLIIGGYTTKDWNTSEKWYYDDQSFLFSLTKEKIFPNKKNCNAIRGSKSNGPWFSYIGFTSSRKNNLTQGYFYYKKDKDQCFENYNEIIPNNNKNTYFDVKEVEIYKIY